MEFGATLHKICILQSLQKYFLKMQVHNNLAHVSKAILQFQKLFIIFSIAIQKQLESLDLGSIK